MTGLIRFVLLIFAVLYQATVSPLFPLGGSQGNVLLIVLALMAVYSGPRTAMWAIPAAALVLGMLNDMGPGLILLGYLPLLPLLMVLESSNVPLGNYMRVAGAVLITSTWARIVLIAAAIAQGADAAPAMVALHVLAPGLFLDIALLTFVYLPQRALRWQTASMRLTRSGYDL